jgi:hypothetical protein
MKSHAKREKTHMAFGAATHPSTSTALATSSELQASLRPLPQVAPSYAPSMHISKICCITVVAPPALRTPQLQGGMLSQGWDGNQADAGTGQGGSHAEGLDGMHISACCSFRCHVVSHHRCAIGVRHGYGHARSRFPTSQLRVDPSSSTATAPHIVYDRVPMSSNSTLHRVGGIATVDTVLHSGIVSPS